MTEQTFSVITLVIAAITALITLIWVINVNKKITEAAKKWDVNKKTLTVILGLLAGLSISTGFKVTIISITAVFKKDVLENLECLHSNTLLAQLLNATGYFAIAGVIFIILGMRGLVVLLKTE
jgi:hypothetical protein